MAYIVDSSMFDCSLPYYIMVMIHTITTENGKHWFKSVMISD